MVRSPRQLKTSKKFDACVRWKYPKTYAVMKSVFKKYQRPRDPNWYNAKQPPQHVSYPQPAARQAETRLIKEGLEAELQLAVSCWLDAAPQDCDPLVLWLVKPEDGVDLPQKKGDRWQEDGGLHVSIVRYSTLEADDWLRERASRIVASNKSWKGKLRFKKPFSKGHVGFLNERKLPGLLTYDALWCIWKKGGGDAHVSF